MKVFRITTLTLILMILISCSQNVKRISYVSVDKPKDGILSNENRSVEFGKFRFGIVYIPPVGTSIFKRSRNAKRKHNTQKRRRRYATRILFTSFDAGGLFY